MSTSSLPRLPLLLIAAALLACSGDDLGPRVPAEVAVTPAAPLVPVGGTLQLTATVLDATGAEMPGEAVTFRSSDATVLTVNGAGLLTSVGSTGSSTITAASGAISAEIEAEAVLPPSAIVVLPRALDLDTGEDATLSFTVTDQNAAPIHDPAVVIEGSNASVMRVETGAAGEGSVLVTGLDAGTATVTLTVGALAAQVPVTVAQHPASAAIAPSSLVFPSVTGAQQATAALLDRTGDAMDAPAGFTWASSDEAVAVVDPTGLVTPVAPGSAVITATTDTFTARLGVFIGTPPAGELLARLPFASARGLAVTHDGHYFVTGADRYAFGALPDFALSPAQVLDGQLPDVDVNAGAAAAYVLRQSGGSGPAVFMAGLDDGAPATSSPLSSGLPTAIAVSPDNTRLLIGRADGFEARAMPIWGTLGVTTVGAIDKVTHHPTRPFFYASGAGGVFEIEATSGLLTRRFRAGAVSHAVGPDGTRLYTVNPEDGIGVWDLDTGARGPRLGAVGGTDLVVSPDGRFLYVIFGSDQVPDGSRLYIVDRASGALLREVVLGGLARRIEMSGDGTAVITNEAGWVDFVH
jgi:uncharacterized protein YjdB